MLGSELPAQAEWLLVPHHGSRSSSSPGFLNAVAPHGGLLSRGRHNSFGHPHPQVVARYIARDVVLHDTAEQGALMLWLGTYGEVSGLREQRRFWREK